MTFMKLSLCTISIFLLHLTIQPLVAQNSTANRLFGGRSSLSAEVSYSPTSQHILVGASQNRKISQVAVGYNRYFLSGYRVSFAYEGLVTPIFLESDPTAIGTSTANISGPPTVVYFPPARTIVTTGAVGYARSGSGVVPILPILGPRETTYAFAALPVGARITAMRRSRVQPTFSVNVGFLYATRNIPVDYTSSFNFLAYAGPGIEIFLDHKRAIRLEYLYEHLSNANLGFQNPGIDSGTFRLTFIHYR